MVVMLWCMTPMFWDLTCSPFGDTRTVLCETLYLDSALRLKGMGGSMYIHVNMFMFIYIIQTG